MRSREAGVGFDEALEHALALRDSVSMYLIPAEGVALGTDGRAPRGIAGLIDRVSARFSGTRDLLRLDPDGIVAGVESSSDFARLCATLAREMSMAAHRHHVSIAYVEVGAGMPRTLTALEKPLNTNEFRSRRLGIANAGGATVCRVGLGAVGVAFVPSSLLRDETLAAVDAARREAGIQQQSL